MSPVTLGLMFAVCLKRDSKSIFFATPTTIHIFGLIKVTATMTPVDSPGSSITITQIMKSTDRNYEKIILTGKHGMDVFLSSFFLGGGRGGGRGGSKDKHLMTNIEKTFALSISVVLKISRRLRLIKVLLGTNEDKPGSSSFRPVPPSLLYFLKSRADLLSITVSALHVQQFF